jgi:hypothetical protein
LNNNALRREANSATIDYDTENRTLVVGDMARWSAAGQLERASESVRFIGLEFLTPEMVDGFAPDLVLSPLFAGSFDALDVARRLSDVGFKGRYRAITDTIPNIEMIRREVIEQSRGLDFDILALIAEQDKTS